MPATHLALNLILDGFLHVAEAVHVFDLNFGAECFTALQKVSSK